MVKSRFKGYSEKFDEWRPCDENNLPVIWLERMSQPADDSLSDRLQAFCERLYREIKRKLYSGRREDPEVRIEIQVNDDILNASLGRIMSKWYQRNKLIYEILSNETLDFYIGTKWNERIMNENGDFANVLPGTLGFWPSKRNPMVEVKLIGDKCVRSEIEDRHQVVFMFVRGDGNSTWVLRVSKWFGVSGSGANGSDRFSTVRGQQLTILSASVISMRRDSSSSWVPWSNNSDDRTDRVVRIRRSQIPPMCEAWGVLELKSIQPQSWEERYSLRGVVSSSLNAEASSFLAPTKFVPWSHLSSRTFPLRLMKRRRAFRNESVVMLFKVSKWIARDERQVNIRPHRLGSFRPSLM